MTFEIPQTVDIPDGTYTGMLESVESDTGSFGNFRRWNWLVDVPGAEGDQILPLSQLTSANTGPQSKSYRQLVALLGREPKAGEKLDAPTGKRVIIKITHNEKRFPTVAEVLPYTDPQVTDGIPR